MPPKATRKTASKRRAPLAFDTESVAAGTSRTFELRVARLPSGEWVHMPVVVVHGKADGPTVWLSAAIHGDELNGVAIIRRILQSLRASHLRGTVIAVPIVNSFGVTAGSRYLPDRRDLNRSFPGSPTGSLTARLAHMFFHRVASRGQLGLDFHTGSNGRCNLPQLRGDLDDPTVLAHARTFAPPVVLDAKTRKGSLRAEAARRGVPVLLYEAGEGLRFDRAAIELGIAGSLRVMRSLGMIDDAPPARHEPVITHKSMWVRAPRSGFCFVEVDLGDTVAAGQRVASIADSVGATRSNARTRSAGVVVGVLETALVHRGDAVVHIAQLGSAGAAPDTETSPAVNDASTVDGSSPDAAKSPGVAGTPAVDAAHETDRPPSAPGADDVSSGGADPDASS